MLAALPVVGAAVPPRLGPAPNFALTTQRHDRVWLTQLRGRVVVLTFTCTTCAACPEIWPALLGLSRELRDAAGRELFFVAVTVDPARDTPSVLRGFARARGLDPRAWLLLTGRPSEVDAVTRRYGVRVHRERGGAGHDCVVVLIDRAGVIRARYGPAELGRVRGAAEALLGESPGS